MEEISDVAARGGVVLIDHIWSMPRDQRCPSERRSSADTMIPPISM
jgi:hypothetical protein